MTKEEIWAVADRAVQCPPPNPRQIALFKALREESA